MTRRELRRFIAENKDCAFLRRRCYGRDSRRCVGVFEEAEDVYAGGRQTGLRWKATKMKLGPAGRLKGIKLKQETSKGVTKFNRVVSTVADSATRARATTQ